MENDYSNSINNYPKLGKKTCIIQQGIDKLWYINKMEYGSEIKGN